MSQINRRSKSRGRHSSSIGCCDQSPKAPAPVKQLAIKSLKQARAVHAPVGAASPVGAARRSPVPAILGGSAVPWIRGDRLTQPDRGGRISGAALRRPALSHCRSRGDARRNPAASKGGRQHSPPTRVDPACARQRPPFMRERQSKPVPGTAEPFQVVSILNGRARQLVTHSYITCQEQFRNNIGCDDGGGPTATDDPQNW